MLIESNAPRKALKRKTRINKMKITVERLKQIIKEELNEVDLAQQFKQRQAQRANQPGDDKGPGLDYTTQKMLDVNRILQYIDKIDTPQEYQNLLFKVVQHASNVRNSKILMMNLHRKILPKIIKDL